jgi:hypothetical protein
MLLCQDCRRHQDSHLPPPHHRLERSTNRNFCLAKTNIPADQPVHRPCRFQVAFRLGDGPHLVWRLLIDEGTLKLALPGRVDRKGMPRLGFACRLDRKQFTGKISNRRLGLSLGPGPTGPPQRVERRTGFSGADVFADQVRLRDRNVKPGCRLGGLTWGIFNDETFLTLRRGTDVGRHLGPATVGRGQSAQTKVAADAMLDMHHIIALF